MAHTYVVTSATYIGLTTRIVGSVDAIPVTVDVLTSDVAVAQASGLAALKTLAATAMLSVAIPTPPATVLSPLPTGTFTQ